MSGADTTESATNALNGDARPAFVTPRDLLQQSRAPLPPKEPPPQLSAIDREQLDGLVRQGLYWEYVQHLADDEAREQSEPFLRPGRAMTCYP
jgi:hypothetical protein